MWRFIKYGYTLALGLLVFCFKQVQQDEKYILPSDEEINKVIQAVVVQDSLFHGERSDIPLAMDLDKLEIRFPDTTLYGKEPPPPPWINNFYELVGVHGKNAPFSVQDSNYLLYQFHSTQEVAIDKRIFQNVCFTTWKEQEPKLRARVHTAFYELSIPLFSADKTKAYVELKFICQGLCGFGKEYLLERRNSSWEIVKKGYKWFE